MLEDRVAEHSRDVTLSSTGHPTAQPRPTFDSQLPSFTHNQTDSKWSEGKGKDSSLSSSINTIDPSSIFGILSFPCRKTQDLSSHEAFGLLQLCPRTLSMSTCTAPECARGASLGSLPQPPTEQECPQHLDRSPGTGVKSGPIQQ